jgi:hypothetical protein
VLDLRLDLLKLVGSSLFEGFGLRSSLRLLVKKFGEILFGIVSLVEKHVLDVDLVGLVLAFLTLVD